MLKRRKFIKGVTALGIVTALAPLSSCGTGEEQAPQEDPVPTVYRFQTRKSRACKYCRTHHRYLVFLDQTAADQNRAHPGCNCKIVTQKVTEAYYNEVNALQTNGVVDLRTAFGYSPPPV